MTPDSWQRAKAIFQQALDLPADERSSFVSLASAGDESILAEVESLLEAHDREAGFSLGTEHLPANMAVTAVATIQMPMRCPDCGARYTVGTSVCEHDGEELFEDPADLVGTTLDDTYRILRLLGRGGMGVVYLAEHVLLHDRVAIKVLPGAATAHAESFRRFLREGRMARAIRHPHVVSVLELRTTDDGTTYMVMEYVEGPTLRDELRRRGKYQLDEALRLLEPVVEALDHAHSLGIVHRDLKPENVIIGGAPDVPDVKLLDLGLARLFDASTADTTANMTTAGQVVGTPTYMPPEQWGQLPADGGSNIDARTDVYSLGVMLFEMVAGRLPFEGKTSHDLRVAHTRETPPALSDLVPDVPQGASEAVARALAKDRSGRQASAGQFLAEVRAAAPQPALSEAESEDDGPRRTKPGRTVRSFMRIAAILVVTLLGAVVIVVILGKLPFGGEPPVTPESRPVATAVDERKLSMRLLARRTRDGVTRVETMSPNVDVVCAPGDGVRVEAATTQNGYLYILNEAPTLDPATALPRYTVIFPKPESRGGSPRVIADGVVSVPDKSWIKFFGAGGRETVWVIWSAQPVEVLRDVDLLVTPEQLGRVTDVERVEAIRQFLASGATIPRPILRASSNPATDYEIATTNDVIVFPLYFEHR